MFLLAILMMIFASTEGRGKNFLPNLSCSKSVSDDGQDLMFSEKVDFKFFYETGCLGCIYFYTEEVDEAFKELADYVNIVTHPFGNGRLLLNASTLEVQCQHREPECYGNRLHACAIDALKDPRQYIPFNACMMRHDMTTITDDVAATECGKKMNVDSSGIISCAKGLRGFQLHLNHAIESKKANYEWVPFWIVNGERSTMEEDRPLKQILCDAFKNPPETCKKQMRV